MLAVRAVVGAVGRLPQQRTAAAFARWDRRLYSPVRLVLAGVCAAGVVRRWEKVALNGRGAGVLVQRLPEHAHECQTSKDKQQRRHVRDAPPISAGRGCWR